MPLHNVMEESMEGGITELKMARFFLATVILDDGLMVQQLEQLQTGADFPNLASFEQAINLVDRV